MRKFCQATPGYSIIRAFRSYLLINLAVEQAVQCEAKARATTGAYIGLH